MKIGWKVLLVLGCSVVWSGCNAATDAKKPGTSGDEGATPAASAPESSQVTEVSGGEWRRAAGGICCAGDTGGEPQSAQHGLRGLCRLGPRRIGSS